MSAKATDASLQQQEVLLANLQHAELFPHPVQDFELLQTHISWVLLTGPYAYKIKKPVDLGFLDFSTLALRKQFCEEELRLNQRLAPQLYLEVIAIHGSHEQPLLSDDSPVIEYAVKMRQFPQSAQLDQVLDRRQLTERHIDQLADTVAAFHQTTERARKDTVYGQLDEVYQPVMENFTHIRHSPGLALCVSRLDTLEAWSRQQFQDLQDFINRRKTEGYIREGHGDMHLHNMALLDEQVVLFDCLEFNPLLRWIDVINDIAFLIMDLDARRQSPFAWRVLNRYLEHTGDYTGLRLLFFYKVYRALVRAKVDAIRLGQAHLTEKEQAHTRREFLRYIALAEQYTRPHTPVLITTRGLSGSGKTTYTQALLQSIGAIRIRSDVERKRLYQSSTHLYSTAITQHVYRYLAELAGELLAAGYPVIVDATFIDHKQLELFQQLAARYAVPFHILEFQAKPDTLRNRILHRSADYSDATIEILERQLQDRQPISENLQGYLISLDTEQRIDIQELAAKLIKPD